MLLNNVLKMEWSKKPCTIQNDFIVQIRGLPVQIYNPFDHYQRNDDVPSLYLKFISIDEKNEKEICKFITDYGFLGLKYFNWPSLFKPGQVEEFKNFLKCGGNTVERSFQDWDFFRWHEGWLFGYDAEPIALIQHEIIKLRTIVLLWGDILSNNIELIQQRHELLSNLCIDEEIESDARHEEDEPDETFTPSYYLDYSRLQNQDKAIVDPAVFGAQQHVIAAKMTLHDIINSYVSNAVSSLGFSWIEPQFFGTWQATSLLVAMYVMLYTEIIGGSIVRKCRNKTCKEFFVIYGNDERRLYCSDTCAHSQAQREYRKRKEDEKRKTEDNNPPSEINGQSIQ